MADSAQNGASILVVDDEQIVLNLVEDTLTDDGYSVTTTASPLEAIDLASQQSFDFILADIRMPEMNGIDLVKEIRRIAPAIGVIFMTGYANLDTAKQAIKEGAYDYIMKPFELSEIRQAISRAVQQKQSTAKATLSRELNKIADLSNLIYTSGDLASLLRLSLSFAIIQSNAEAGIAVYVDHGRGEIVLMDATRIAEANKEPLLIPVAAEDVKNLSAAKSPILLADESGHPLSGTDVFAAHRESFLPQKYFRPHATVISPLVRSEKMLGFITLFHPHAEYDLKDSDTQFLNFISSQLAISLENLQLLHDSQEAYRRLEYLQDQIIRMEKMATRGQMSAEIGHELNNYLGVVVANFQLMNVRLQKGVTEGLERFSESINDHLDKISRFIKGLMDYSSLKQTSFKPVDIDQLLKRIVDFLQPQKRFRQVDIVVQSECEGLTAEMDQGLVEQVLYNLLNNAADASLDSKTRKIEITVAKLDEGMIRLTVRDQGKGIDEEDLKKLFKEKFTTKDSGHGIGLVVCKNIIDKHNGRITVESVHGQGTAFMIDLPILHQPAPKTAAPA